jgi:cyclic AMP-dependent transcription factor ATF-4
MFSSTLMDFDLRLLQPQDEQEPCSVFYEEVNDDTNDAVSYKILDGQHMEEDEIGLLQSSSDLQAFINMASLPEVKVGDENVDVEKVITDVTDFLQKYDTTGTSVSATKNPDLMVFKNAFEKEDSKEDTAAAVDLLDELLKYNDINLEEEFAPVLSSEDLPAEEMAAAEDILDELLKSGNISMDDFDLSDEVPEEQMKVEHILPTQETSNQDESVLDDPNDSGFIDMTTTAHHHITVDGQEIFIVVAPPSPEHKPEVTTTLVTAPESFAILADPIDPDWTPDSPKTTKGRPLVKRSPPKAKSSRKAPYIKDKKERKKQQNVEAARRYRDKKKSEFINVESVEQTLADKNKDLKSEVADLEVKVRTMKQLMAELGILKA